MPPDHDIPGRALRALKDRPVSILEGVPAPVEMIGIARRLPVLMEERFWNTDLCRMDTAVDRRPAETPGIDLAVVRQGRRGRYRRGRAIFRQFRERYRFTGAQADRLP
jgi:hypothetical protein